MAGSPGRKTNSRVTIPQGRSSVAELVTRYQNMSDCANPSSAVQKTQTPEKGFSKKREAAQPGIDLRISPKADPDTMNKKSREKLALQQARPFITKTKKVSHRKSDPFSPDMVGHINQTSNFDLNKTGKKMETLHHPKIKFQPRMEHPVPCLLNTNRREEQGTGALAVPDGDLGKKLAPCKRINRAAPSTKLTLAYPALKVNNYEKFPRVLAASDNRSHVFPQGEGFSRSLSVKDRSALYLSQVAAAAVYPTNRPTEWVEPQEICALCCMPVYPPQRLVIQNIPMHQMCFCCQHCKRNLSLLNYALFQGAFYCKVCSKLLAEVVGKRAPDTALSPNHQQLPLKHIQPNPRQVSKNKSGPTGSILAREKMPQRSSNLSLQSDKVTSQEKPKNIYWPLKKEAKNYIGRKHDRSGTKETWLQDSSMALHSPEKSDRSYHKTREDNSIPESFGEQKKRQLPRVIGPKCGDHVLHRIKKVHGSQELGSLENRPLSVDKGIVGIQVGKTGSSILEKARRFQSSTSEVEKSISKLTPLSVSLPRSSLGGPFLSSEGKLRCTPKTTKLGSPQLAIDRFQGKNPGGVFSWKVTSGGKNPRQMVEHLPTVRTMLPALAPPLEQRSKKKLQKASQENTLNTLEAKVAEEPNYKTMAPMKIEKPTQSKPEGLVSSPGREEKKNNQTEQDEKALAFSVDPMKSCLKTNQDAKPSWMSKNEFLREVTETLQLEKQPGMDNQLSPEILPLNEEDKKDEMYPRGISDNFVTLTCFSVFQDTEPKDRTSSSATDGNIEDGSSLSSSQADDDDENREVLSRNNLQEHPTSICNPEHAPEVTHTNEKLQAKASSGHNLEFASQEVTSRNISHLSSAQDLEILPSCEVPYLIEKQETGHITMEIKAQHESAPFVETSQDIIDQPSRKQLLKKQNNPIALFFVSKTRRSVPSQKPTSGIKKAPKTQSALLTLFGHSVNKDKSHKEWPRKDLGKLSGKVNLQSTYFSSLPKSDFSKKDENSGVVLQTRNSDPRDSKESCGICPKGTQNGNSPSLDSVNIVSSEISSLTRMQSSSKSCDIPRQSNIVVNTEHTAKESEQSLPFTSFQSCVMSTENMPQYSANTLVETSVSCRNSLSEQELDNVDSQDLELKARNVSLLDSLAKDETEQSDEEIQVPDTLSSFQGMEESANMEKENAESSPGSHTEFVDMKDQFCSGSSENFLRLSCPQFAELEPNMVIKEDSLRNSQPPDTGNFQTLEYNSDHPFEQTLHAEQATNENYSIEENHFHPVLIPSQSMPELLRDTLQSKATGRSAEAKSPAEDQVSENRHPQEQLL